jgi:uncharacterized membrane protein
MRFEVVQGETEYITMTGRKVRNPTVLIRVGRVSLSKKAAILGAVLVLCQVLDGLLTYLGLTLYGTEMEGNTFLRELMHAYGTAPALFLVKISAISLAVLLTLHAHRRRWVRPIIFALAAIYLFIAVVPWVFIISAHLS